MTMLDHISINDRLDFLSLSEIQTINPNYISVVLLQ